MTPQRLITTVIMIVLMSTLSSGCTVYNALQSTTTLELTPSESLQCGDMKFRIAEINGSAGDLNAMAIKAFPKMFSKDLEAWPLQIDIDCESKTNYDYSLWSLLTLTIVPFPAKSIDKYYVTTTVCGTKSQLVSFSMEVKIWTGTSVLWLIPVPSYLFADDARAMVDMRCASIVAAVAQQIKQMDLSATLSNPEILAKLAVNDNNVNIRRAATKKLTDQTLLTKIAVDDPDQCVRHAAVEKLADQAMLAKIAMNDKETYIRITAVGKLSDLVLLAKIKSESKDSSVCASVDRRLAELSAKK